ncbi:unnamed protein product [Haemonchus placei]|uniref:Ovule protein n=1 Tax=Haemonchus placei TaxID=6290 RepID=A0A0N4W6X7_HAEPC|nr:unnamed protein product [Haemonchus placei]
MVGRNYIKIPKSHVGLSMMEGDVDCENSTSRNKKTCAVYEMRAGIFATTSLCKLPGSTAAQLMLRKHLRDILIGWLN